MALIVCPECGGKVSDKAKTCIHCGYPMDLNNIESNNEAYRLILQRIDKDNIIRIRRLMLKIIKSMSIESIKKATQEAPTVLFTGLREDNADWVLHELRTYGADVIKEKTTDIVDEDVNAVIDVEKRGDITCPKCGSTQIAWLPRGVKGYGSLFEHHVCKKCGYSWAV